MTASISQEMFFARQKIIRAAQNVLASKKVSGTRMRQIAQKAGISQGTLHYYFPSKTGLLLAVLDEMQKFFELRQKQLLANELGATGKINLFSDQQKQLLLQYPQLEEIFLDFWGHALINPDIRDKTISMYAAWRRDILLAIQQGVESGEFDPVQAKITPYLFVALLEGIALQYLLDKSQIDLEQAFQSINQMMIHWLRGDCAGDEQDGNMSAVRPGRKPYPTDLNEKQWSRVSPLLDPPKDGGRPRTTDLRQIVNALLYTVTCGCPWRMLPHDFPGWQTVYAYYRLWNTNGTMEKIGAVLGVDFYKKGNICEQGK
jgi:AcrR family transcriptional regulator/transposase